MGNREGSWRAGGSGYGDGERTAVVGHGVARRCGRITMSTYEKPFGVV